MNSDLFVIWINDLCMHIFLDLRKYYFEENDITCLSKVALVK